MTPAELKASGITLPPTQDELPSDDGDKMETERHFLQMSLLIETLRPWLDKRSDGYVGGNMFVYYSLSQVKNQDFKGPDFFAVVGVPKKERKSWVCWEEGKPPDVVIELLSDSTADYDKNQKKQVYQDRMHVTEYFWYDPWNSEDWAGFQLQGGQYVEIPPNSQGQLLSQVLNLALVRWQGSYLGVETTWLRWMRLDGTLLPTKEEKANQAEARAAQAQAEAVQAQAEAAQAQAQIQQIVQNLLQTGMSFEQVSAVTGLSVNQIESVQQRSS